MMQPVKKSNKIYELFGYLKKKQYLCTIFVKMQQKRNYIMPQMTIEYLLSRDCWMMAGISGAIDPGINQAPAHRTPAF